MDPLVSIVIPIYNSAQFIRETIRCFLDQTYQNFEIICVDDGSEDDSVPMIRQIADSDPRIHIYSQTNQGAGAARNHGLRRCSGKYIYFFDSDNLCDKTLLEKAVAKLEETGADIVGFNFRKMFPDGTELPQTGCYVSQLHGETDVFNYSDLPDSILNVYRPVSWNKVYRADFLKLFKLHFDEISSANDITFAAVTAAYARKATFIPDELVRYRIRETDTITKTKVKNIRNVITALESTERQVKMLDYYDEIKPAVREFVIGNYIYSLLNYTDNFRSENVSAFYNHVRDIFSKEDPDGVPLNNDNDRWFRIIRKYDFEQFMRLYDKKIIVSMTTYPARIGGVSSVLETIYSQTRKADEVVLWLADSQFPGRENDLPDELKDLVNEKKLTVEFCRDMKAHKKYLYAFDKYPDALIITVDDDLLYHPDMISNLFCSWLEFPDAVSTMRAHLMVIDREAGILPYNDWFKETNACLRKPCMQLLATGGAGAVYYPPLFDRTFFDEELILKLCYDADDIWLKLIEVYSDIPVVLARPNRALKYLPGSQTEALWHSNVSENLNDLQLKAIQEYLIESFGENFLLTRIIEYPGKSFLSTAALMEVFLQEKKALNRRKNDLQDKLKRSQQEVKRINERLQKAFQDKKNISRNLEQTRRELEQTKIHLNHVQNEKGLIEKSTSWKIGSAITRIPGTIKRKLQHKS